LQQYKTLERQQLDQVLQVVFDLQTADAHEDALQLFEMLLKYTSDTKKKRELYYWMAESRTALKQYAEAARLYLKSAMLIGEDAMDPWAQTARYQAGVALSRAGMLQDARTLFSNLLRVTKDKSRRAVLRHELQKLWLLEDDADSQADSTSITVGDAVADPS
jgi:tetratricopeptide (TPR) repeat protein